MALTPREQHQWFLITQDITASGGLVDPRLEDAAVMMWRYLLSATYITIGLLALAIGLFAPNFILVPLGFAAAVVGVYHFVATYHVDRPRHGLVPIHQLGAEGDWHGL